MDSDKKGVIILHKYEQSLKKLSHEEQGKILMASLLYDKTGEIPEFNNPVTEMLFSVMKQDFDSLRESWENKKKSNHERAKAGADKRWSKESEVSNNKNANNANSISSINENANNAYNGNDCDYVSEYDNVSDTDSVSDSEIPQDDNAAEPLEADEAENDNSGSKKESDNPPGKSDNTPYKKIESLYNSICERLPKIKIIDGDRKKAVAARFATYKNLEFFKNLFETANASDFLCGTNPRNWRADFDWLMSATNIPKVVEGKYDNKEFTSTPPNNNSPPGTYPAKSINPFADYVDKCENDGEEIYYREQH